ncbi:MAG: virulence RhuM family protein [Bacilli bacterium]|nr:virulence RhuM family protein [Bacilli bacterium]
MKDDTVWLSANQMAKLFMKDEKTIRKHINNVFKDEEVEKENNTQKMRVDGVKQLVPFYSLDVIISIGYRVKSKNGIIFRRWANRILKDYMIKGYAINNKRLEYLEKTVQLLDIANRGRERISDSEAKGILEVISSYSKALNLLDDYDHKRLKKMKGNKSNKKITYEECIDSIGMLKFNTKSNLFALERDKGLKSIINNIYQSFDGRDVYSSVEQKGANLLYMIVKDHVFIDGNKRIAATLFIYFLQYYGILYKDNEKIIDNNTLTALTILIAESNPKEKDIMTDLILNFFYPNEY